MSILLRLYEKKDFTGLQALLNTTYGSTIERDVFEREYITDNRNVLVAIDSDFGNVVGSTFVELQQDYVRPNRIAYITYVAVDETYRKKGIGKQLIQKVEELCEEWKCSAIELTSANFRVGAHEFYKRLGFTVKQTTVFIKEMEG